MPEIIDDRYATGAAYNVISARNPFKLFQRLESHTFRDIEMATSGHGRQGIGHVVRSGHIQPAWDSVYAKCARKRFQFHAACIEIAIPLK